MSPITFQYGWPMTNNEWRMAKTGSIMSEVSIVLLTFNGEKYLPQILEMISRQKVQPREILAIDSGSTDATLDILGKAQVALHQIPQSDFSHSRTRNLAAGRAGGCYVVFLTQDATPADSCWLERLLHSFSDYPRVAGAFSRQASRPGASLLEANDLHLYFKSVRQIKTYPDSPEYFRQHVWDYIQFSNVSAVYNRELLLANPFDESLAMGEDQEWAKRMLEKGYAIVYEPESVVLHSHDHSFAQKRNRSRQMGTSFSQFLSQTLGKRAFPLGPWGYHVFSDMAFMVRAGAPFLSKLKWALLSPIHRAATHHAYYSGWNSNAKPAAVQLLQLKNEKV